MNLVESLPQEDRDIFRAYAYNCEGADSPSVTDEHLFRFWNENKQNLYRILGNNFILNKEVICEKAEKELWTEMQDFIETHSLCLKLQNILTEWSNKRWSTLDIEERRKYDAAISIIEDSMSAYSLVHNKIDIYSPSCEIAADLTVTGKKVKIEKGAKPIKALQKIAKALDLYDEAEFEDFRIKHSQILNEKYLKGNLCLSIHPMDYATLSDNECNWCSCMSWIDNGEYHQGTIEMMNSPYMVVAYLTSSKNYTPFEGIEWNSKKWRKLYIVSPHLIMGIKAYPYQADDLDIITLNWLRDLAEAVEGYGPYCDKMIKASIYEEAGNEKVNLVMNHMYNDISSNHNAYITHTGSLLGIDLNLSGQSECLKCGADCTNSGICNDSLLCYECGEYECCPCCEGHYRSESTNWFELCDGSWICENCYEENTMSCERCDCVDYCSNCYELEIRNKTIRLTTLELCHECYKWYKEHFTIYEDNEDPWSATIFYIMVEDANSIEDINEMGLYEWQEEEAIKAWEEYQETNKEDLDLKN